MKRHDLHPELAKKTLIKSLEAILKLIPEEETKFREELADIQDELLNRTTLEQVSLRIVQLEFMLKKHIPKRGRKKWQRQVIAVWNQSETD